MRYHYNTVTSTNDYAKELLNDYPEVLVTADYQSHGRGRKGKTWVGDYGKNLYLTKGFSQKSFKHLSNISLYQAVACLSVKKSLQSLIPQIKLSLKYPNDVYAFDNNDFKKLSGALIEQGFLGDKLDYTLIGIGININQTKFPEDLQSNATSLSLLGFELNSIDLINKIDENINQLISNYESEIFLEWQTELKLLNKQITVLEKGEWQVKEILNDGRLLLKKDEEEIIIDNGDSVRYELG